MYCILIVSKPFSGPSWGGPREGLSEDLGPRFKGVVNFVGPYYWSFKSVVKYVCPYRRSLVKYVGPYRRNYESVVKLVGVYRRTFESAPSFLLSQHLQKMQESRALTRFCSVEV